MLSAHVAGDGDTGCGAEEPVLDPGRGETAILARDCEVARRDQLATRCGRHAVRGRDHRHRHRLNGRHEAVADGEDLALFIERAGLHLLEVMTRREATAGALEHDRPHFGPRSLTLELGGELPHEASRKGVQLVGAVEGDHRGRSGVIDEQVIESDSHLQTSWSFESRCGRSASLDVTPRVVTGRCG